MMIKKILANIILPWKKYKEYRELKKRIEDLRKRDPFIYK